MTLPLIPALPAVNDISTIPQDVVNGWRAAIAKAVDGVGGGTYTPSVEVNFAGEGVKISGSGDAARLKYASSSEVRTQRSLLLNNDTGAVKVGSIVLAPTEQGMQYLTMPDGATLASVTVYHNRDDTGLMPATRVQLLVWKLDITTGTATQLGVTTTDPTANLAAYQAHHGFSISTIGEVVDNEQYVYYVIVNGEAGANATNTTWYGCRVTTTVTSQDKAP